MTLLTLFIAWVFISWGICGYEDYQQVKKDHERNRDVY